MTTSSKAAVLVVIGVAAYGLFLMYNHRPEVRYRDEMAFVLRHGAALKQIVSRQDCAATTDISALLDLDAIQLTALESSGAVIKAQGSSCRLVFPQGFDGAISYDLDRRCWLLDEVAPDRECTTIPASEPAEEPI